MLDGGIRTLTELGLSQLPLPVGLRQHSLSTLGEIRTHHCPVSKTGDSYQLVYEGINDEGGIRTRVGVTEAR